MAGVWAILQHRDGKAHSGSWEAVTAAKRIAEAVGETADAVLLGADVKALADEAARTGVASVRVADHPALANYVPGPYTAALVGADGLGKPVVRALNTVNVAMGFEAGLAIVILAILLDRVCKRPEPVKRRA